jgi:hypothetical protein
MQSEAWVDALTSIGLALKLVAANRVGVDPGEKVTPPVSNRAPGPNIGGASLLRAPGLQRARRQSEQIRGVDFD